jgi:hypothetical protein
MIDFLDRSRMVAVVFEVLRQRHEVGERFSKMRGKVPHFYRIRTPTRKQGMTRRTAYSQLAIGSIESRSLRSKPIDIGADRNRIAITPEHWPQVVDTDKKNVQGGERSELKNANCKM